MFFFQFISFTKATSEIFEVFAMPAFPTRIYRLDNTFKTLYDMKKNIKRKVKTNNLTTNYTVKSKGDNNIF